MITPAQREILMDACGVACAALMAAIEKEDCAFIAEGDEPSEELHMIIEAYVVDLVLNLANRSPISAFGAEWKTFEPFVERVKSKKEFEKRVKRVLRYLGRN